MTTITPAGAPPAAARGVDARRGILLFLVMGLTFAFVDAVVKYLSRHYPIVQIAWARYLFSIPAMLALIPRPYSWRSFVPAKPLLQLIRAVLLLAVTVLFFICLANMTLTDAQAFLYTAPLLVTALGALVLGEQVGWRRWTAVTVGFGGVLIIVQPGAGVWHWAAGAGVLMALCTAVMQIMTRVLGRYDSAFTTAFYGVLAATALLSMAAPFVWKAPDLLGWFLLVAAGLFGGVGHYFLAAAFTHAPASTLAPYLYVGIVWASLSGYFIFSEVPGFDTWLGAAIIIGSGVYIFMREKKLKGAH